MVTNDALARAYAACTRLAQSHYENFPVASHLLPVEMRPHIAAVYAFARVADDFADEGDAPASERQAKLRDWQARLHRAVAAQALSTAVPASEVTSAAPAAPDQSAAPASPARPAVPAYAASMAASDYDLMFLAIGNTIRERSLPVSLFDDLISAFAQDTETTRYATWDDVLDYCRRSANPVGRLVLRIAGREDAALDRSSDALCTALQLTNFWQDLGRDWHNGRLYVPREVSAACGASEQDLANGQWSPAWIASIETCIAVTRRLFDEGRAVCDGVRGRLRYELRFTWLGGSRILDRVESGRHHLFTTRPALGAGDLPPLLWRAATWRGLAA